MNSHQFNEGKSMSKSILADYVRREKEIKRLNDELKKLENDPRLQAAKEFRSEVEALMVKHGISGTEAVYIIQPELASKDTKSASEATRRRRRMKRYTNPMTDEVVETRGGNHKALREWKKEFGDEEVNSWGEFIE